MMIPVFVRCCLIYLLFMIPAGAVGKGFDGPVSAPTFKFHFSVADSLPADTILASIFRKHPLLSRELTGSTARSIQLIFTQVQRGANGMPAFRHHYWKTDTSRYFYPGAAVRLPLAMLVMQQMNSWKPLGIDRATTLITDKARPGQVAVMNDPESEDGRPTPGLYLKKMLVGEDNEAFNRLYELLSQQLIQQELRAKGYSHLQIVQRLGKVLDDEENRCANPVIFLGPANREIYRLPLRCNTDVYAPRRDSLGSAYYSNGKLFAAPLNCSNKNRASLADLHQQLISLVFPSKVTAAQRFSLSEEDRNFLLRCLSEWPGESDFPPYADQPERYFPGRSKYLLMGGDTGRAPRGVRIFNVSGKGYGQLTDVAYIVDFDRKVEFFLSAVVDCAKGGVLHHDRYEYQEAGLPVMRALGQVLLEYAASRERSWPPDLQSLQFEYGQP